MVIRFQFCVNFFIVFLRRKISDVHVPLLERGRRLLLLKSRDLRTGRAPKDLKILLSKLFSAKFKCVSFLSLDKQSDSGKKKKNPLLNLSTKCRKSFSKKRKNCRIMLCISTIIEKQEKNASINWAIKNQICFLEQSLPHNPIYPFCFLDECEVLWLCSYHINMNFWKLYMPFFFMKPGAKSMWKAQTL